MATNRKMFVNLPVHDLQKSMRFFSTLGFEFNKQFTNESGACMMISDEAFVMLLSEPFFKTFTKQALCDTKTSTEGLFALSCENRAGVDELVKKAIAAGGRHAMDAQDHGFMYGWSFYDLDGHHWEVLWMDPSVVQPVQTVDMHQYQQRRVFRCCRAHSTSLHVGPPRTEAKRRRCGWTSLRFVAAEKRLVRARTHDDGGG